MLYLTISASELLEEYAIYLRLGIFVNKSIIMANDNDDFNQFPESNSLTQNTYYNLIQNGISFIFEYKNQRQWVKVLYPYSYEMFEAKAKEIFFDLNNKRFKFYDEKKAILTEEFLIEHVQFFGRGAIIIIEVNSPTVLDLDYPTTPSSSSNITVTDTSEEDEAGTSQQNVHNFLFLQPQLPKGKIITKEIIKKDILENPCGKDIFEEYNKKGFLSDINRRRMINIVVTQMLALKKELKGPLTSSDKCQFAKIIVELFPKLRDPETILGCESFYDPVTKTGYLANRLSNVRRGMKRKTICNEDSENNRKDLSVNITQNENETLTQAEIEDIILFLKSATQDQKSQIISKHKDTFQYRRKFCLNINFFDIFPRFLDTPELIEEEYKLLFPKYDDFFLKEFTKFCEIILRVFSKIDYEIHPPIDKLEEAWDKHTRAILALSRLLPPTARGKNKAVRDKSTAVLEKIILFKKNNTPLESESKQKTQSRLVAVGSSKAAVTQYFLNVDNKFILLHVQNFMKAFDILFKSHFVFNTQYDSNLIRFYRFIETYFYKINNGPVTPRVREVYTLLRNQMDV
ncbi:uncharacterized protein [Anoplolepis gracilipes]|uniref:uncharacterized protein isoform X2 n=1 Tax=Anoplolepis gracilipes TaxID=354296 RepID=UPI003BA2ED45